LRPLHVFHLHLDFILIWLHHSSPLYVLQADHPESTKEWHQAVLSIYKRQVIASRYMQQQQQQQGALDAPLLLLQTEEVAPSQFMNDGYIWLALTHHLLGAGLAGQVRPAQQFVKHFTCATGHSWRTGQSQHHHTRLPGLPSVCWPRRSTLLLWLPAFACPPAGVVLASCCAFTG
jgi:hypothetical protein